MLSIITWTDVWGVERVLSQLRMTFAEGMKRVDMEAAAWRRTETLAPADWLSTAWRASPKDGCKQMINIIQILWKGQLFWTLGRELCCKMVLNYLSEKLVINHLLILILILVHLKIHQFLTAMTNPTSWVFVNGALTASLWTLVIPILPQG